MPEPRRATTMYPSAAVGSYDVVRKLATGGMGEVFLAQQRGAAAFKREVVLKKLHPEMMNDPQFVEMFANEAQLAASLSHPNIVHIYDLFEDDGYVLAMEYVRGGTALSLLRYFARNGEALPYGPALRIAIAVCEALHYAYTSPGESGFPRRIVHRDISPSNILVGYDGHVKLADFGVAKAIDVNLTRGNTVKGKYGYLSPEQIRCEPLDNRCDIFALGIVLWEMTVGTPLFKRDNDVAMMYAVVEEETPRPSERHPAFPPALEAIIMKALQKDREDRYLDALEMAADLRKLARENDWDLEAPTLAEIVFVAVPAEQIAFGRTGSDNFSGLGPKERSRTTHGGDWNVAPDLSIAVEITPPPAPVVAPKPSWRPVLATSAVMVLLSAIFWIFIAPALV
jgi:serine/threonine-protein kinase